MMGCREEGYDYSLCYLLTAPQEKEKEDEGSLVRRTLILSFPTECHVLEAIGRD